MADVARESGVSLSTVSMVLADKPGLPAGTRQRVLRVAHVLGYHGRVVTVPPVDCSLKTVFMFLKGSPGEVPRFNDFYSHVITGIEAACHQRNIDLVFSTIPVDQDNIPLETPAILQRENDGGFLFVGIYLDEHFEHILKQNPRPIVLVDAYSASGSFDSVINDNVSAAYQATCYLISRGHRQIGFIGGKENAYPSFCERRRGYLQALQDHHLPGPYFADATTDRSDVIESATQLLSQYPQITALFGCNDFMVISAMHAALQMGRSVPRDLSVMGVDDILMAESVIPPLTTMQIDKLNMGRLAVQLLVNRAEVPEAMPVTALLRPLLVERSSVWDLKPENVSLVNIASPLQD
jgi:LacI family transcriptional regulator